MAPRLSSQNRIQALIATESQLDDLLSTPSQADIDAMRELRGDLILLGVGGKMGPTLAIRAKRASDAAGTARRIIGVSRFSSADSQDSLSRAGVETISADLLQREQLASLPDAPN